MSFTSWMRSHRRLCIGVALLALLLIAYTLFGFYGVPRLAERAIRGQMEPLGHHVEIGPIHFHPFKFQASIENLRITEGSGAPLIGFAKLAVDLETWRSIVERGAVLAYLRLDEPDISLVVEPDGKVNLARLAAPRTEPAPPPSQEPATIPHLRIGEFTLGRGRVGIEDRSRPKPFALQMTPIDFTLRDFRTATNHANIYSFSGQANTGEKITWSGDFTVQPLGSKGKFSVENAQSSTAVAYLQDLLPVRLVSGVAQTAGEYRMTLDPALSLDVELPALTVRDLGLAEFDTKSTTPSVAAGEIVVSQIALSLAKREVRVGGVDLRGVKVGARREADGALNLSRLVAPAPLPAQKEPPKIEPAPPAPASAPPEWRVTVGGVRLHAASIALEDHAVTPAVKLDLAPIDAQTGALSSDLTQPITLEAGIGIGANKGGRVEAKGTLGLKPLTAKFDVDVGQLDVSVVQPYIAPHTGVQLASARLGVDGTVDWAQEPARLTFDGKARIAGLALREPGAKRDLIGWQDLGIDGIAFDLPRKRLDIARVDLTAPVARIEISAQRQINLAQALAPPASTQAPAAPAPAKKTGKEKDESFAVRVKTVRIQRGTLDFADRSIEPAFAAAIQKLEGRIDGISTRPDASAKIDLKGQVDAFSPVLIQGELIPLAYDKNTTIALSFRNMDLVRFNPYSGRFAGYNIVKGKLSTELKYRIEKRALQAEHHVIVDQLEFGDATGSKDAVPLPVKLAVALLKDRHGTIDLSLPVAGNLDDPTFRVGPLVWKVLVNLLTKAVTAPFSALASLFGGGGEDMKFVAFAPGSANLEAAEVQQLEALSKALVERPQLKLDVPYAFDEKADGEAMARTEVAKAIADEKTGAPPEDDGDRLDALEDLHKKRLGAKPKFPEDAPDLDRDARRAARLAWLEGVMVDNFRPDAAALEALAAARAQSVQAALLARAELQPERVFLTSRHTGALDESGRVRMELTLQ
ncbi:MAG: hypothetical protein K0Q76_419 [Panacagrimonas sp.]|nr:DUF748 domain-containing protein [Panacagrimonas sp.]MCC2655311.1 hypothetical protein [Panacagrimonas sp.]